MAINWNTCAVDTCKANRKGIDSNALNMDDLDRGDYVHLVEDRVEMVIMQWEDSKILQSDSTVMQPRATNVTRHLGQEVIHVSCPNDIVL
eukprot:1877913-Ditylum_brightwellii.AAC.1